MLDATGRVVALHHKTVNETNRNVLREALPSLPSLTAAAAATAASSSSAASQVLRPAEGQGVPAAEILQDLNARADGRFALMALARAPAHCLVPALVDVAAAMKMHSGAWRVSCTFSRNYSPDCFTPSLVPPVPSLSCAGSTEFVEGCAALIARLRDWLRGPRADSAAAEAVAALVVQVRGGLGTRDSEPVTRNP